MKKRNRRSYDSSMDSSDNDEHTQDEGFDSDDDGTTRDETDKSEEPSQSQPSTTPQVTDGSSRYDEEISTTTDFTSSSKTNTTVTTVDHYYYTTDTTTLPLTNATVISYSTTSSTMSSYTPIREMMSTPPPSSGSPGALLTTQRLVWLVTFPSLLIAIVVLLLIIWFLRKTFRSRSKGRRNQPDAEEKVGKPKDLKGKDGNIDVEYHHALKPSNYYTEVGKELKSTSKGAESKAKASPGQYEEIDKISPADQPKSMTSSNHGDNQGYEETSQHKTPFYYTLEPPDNGVSNDGEVTSHQNLGYDKLDRGRDPNNIVTGNNPGYAKLDHTPRGENDYDRLNRDGAIEKPSQDNEISTNEYSQLDIEASSASESYDKLNHERKNTGK